MVLRYRKALLMSLSKERRKAWVGVFTFTVGKRNDLGMAAPAAWAEQMVIGREFLSKGERLTYLDRYTKSKYADPKVLALIGQPNEPE